MAQLLTPSHSGMPHERISQMLPTVKCSNCNASVSLSDLGEHVCGSGPGPAPSPGAVARPPRSQAHLLPQRLQQTAAPPSPRTPQGYDQQQQPPQRAQQRMDGPGPMYGGPAPPRSPNPNQMFPGSMGPNSQLRGQMPPPSPGGYGPTSRGGLLGDLPPPQHQQVPFPGGGGYGQTSRGGLLGDLPAPPPRTQMLLKSAAFAGSAASRLHGSPPVSPLPSPAFSGFARMQSGGPSPSASVASFAHLQQLQGQQMPPEPAFYGRERAYSDARPSGEYPRPGPGMGNISRTQSPAPSVMQPPQPAFRERERTLSERSRMQVQPGPQEQRGEFVGANARTQTPVPLQAQAAFTERASSERSRTPAPAPTPVPPPAQQPSFRERLQQKQQQRQPEPQQQPPPPGAPFRGRERAYSNASAHSQMQGPPTQAPFRDREREWERPQQPSQAQPTAGPLVRERSGGRPPAINVPPPQAFTRPEVEVAVEPPQPETKVGGEAGMAGVGRRGYFAAAAVSAFSRGKKPHGVEDDSSGMAGRRENSPRYLDTSSTRRPETPPLSPNSGPHTPTSPAPQSPHSASGHAYSHHAGPAIASSRTPSPSGPLTEHYRDVPEPKTPTPASTPPAAFKLPFFEKYKNKLSPNASAVVQTQPAPDPDRRSEESDSDYGGLAYAESTADGESSVASPPTAPLRLAKSPSDSSVFVRNNNKANNNKDNGKVPFPKSPSSRAEPTRSISSVSSYSTQRTGVKSTGAIERALDSLTEDLLSPSSPTTPLSAGEKSPKMPTRSHTTPTIGSGKETEREKGKVAGRGRSASNARRVKECVRCEMKIADGRWIQADGAGVLCERCWKNMYLPKCRRCNLPIEKQAVSSSDGQLKGKYHRECFNCNTCHKPFPDKEFYVFEGKPFCKFHYHEANESLCAAATCGQPIEGPCAVSHSGDRYHPEHLLCEYEFARCTVPLADEYWEVDGRMLCERHAYRAEQGEGDEDDDDEDIRDAGRAQKRITRFIDLAGLGQNGLQ